MKSKIMLRWDYFTERPTELFSNAEFTVKLFKYPSQIEAIELTNSRGRVVVLPFMGQMIWDLSFDGIALKMKNMFAQPKAASCVVDTYGCFAFHSGIIANGCPSPDDTHPLHGEMPCAKMDEAWLEIDEHSVTIAGRIEYVQGFGHHYLANPSVTLAAKATQIEIGMCVENLASVPMPLQYMCHMNYAYVPEGEITSTLPDTAFALRESIPAHVKSTPEWLKFNEEIKAKQKQGKTLTSLTEPTMYDPEIVFMADHIDQYGDEAVVEIASPKGYSFWLNQDGVHRVKAYQVGAVDTSGAGDAFIGCFADHYVKTNDVLTSMQKASAFSALSVTKKGTQVSYPGKEELESFLKNELS